MATGTTPPPKLATAVPSVAARPPVAAPRPRLGDLITAWDSAYPGFVNSSDQHQTTHVYSTTVAALHAVIIAVFDPGSHRALSLSITLPDQPWSIDEPTPLTVPTLFLPLDARSQGQSPLSTGLFWQWTAPSLGTHFAASYFMNNQGTLVAPGSCAVFYHYDGPGGLVTHATINLGGTYG